MAVFWNVLRAFSKPPTPHLSIPLIKHLQFVAKEAEKAAAKKATAAEAKQKVAAARAAAKATASPKAAAAKNVMKAASKTSIKAAKLDDCITDAVLEDLFTKGVQSQKCITSKAYDHAKRAATRKGLSPADIAATVCLAEPIPTREQLSATFLH